MIAIGRKALRVTGWREFEKKIKAPLVEVGARQSPDAYVRGAVNVSDPYSLCSRELLPAEVSPS